MTTLKMSSLRICEKFVNNASKQIYFIAEIGQNHQGNIDIAKQMIIEAKAIGCNCVKFQKSCLHAKFTKAALDRIYDGEHSWGRTYGEHKKHLEFDLDQYRVLQDFCKNHGIEFTASAMDEISLMQLDALDVPFIKIGSGDANNFPLLRKAGTLKRPLVISTGMQDMQTVSKIVDIMRANGKIDYALLHCVSSYPTKPEDCNLQMITELRCKFPEVLVGYSGHEEGIEISKAATLLGAAIVERHLTLDKKQKGSDHKCSLEPKDFQKLIENIRALQEEIGAIEGTLSVAEIVDLLGAGKEVELALTKVECKVIFPCELSCRNKLGKSLVATRMLKVGHRIQCEDICVKVSEPMGISAEHYEDIIGKELITELEQDDAFQSRGIRF